MKPIQGYDLVNEAGEFKRLPAGIYLVKITNVVDKPENEYLEVYCEIAKGEFAGYFTAMGKEGDKTIRSYKTNALPFFKGFITAVEKTNAPYKWDWDESKLVGKAVYAVYGEEEYLKDGEVKVGTHLVEFRSVEAFNKGIIKVPELKKLPQQAEPDIPAEPIDLDKLPF